MSIKLPTDVSTESTTATETETETDPREKYAGHEGTYFDYWGYTDLKRYGQKACQTLGVAKVKDAGKSPFADHYCHFRDEQKVLKDKVNGQGDFEADGALPGSLPDFKEAFGEPEFDHIKVTADNADEFGIDPDLFKEDEDPIFVKADYEVPETVWYDDEETDGDLTLETVLRIAEETDGIGKKTLAALKANLEAEL